MTKLGFVLGSTVPPAHIATVARVVEDVGFDTIWMSEDYFFTGGIAGAAIALGATTRISVGIGLLPIYVRHPALTAMEAGTLAGAFPGRLQLGLGSGVSAWLDQMGTSHARPLGSMREAVAAVRTLLGGEIVGRGEHFAFDSVKLTYPPDEAPPIYIGATGPKMTALPVRSPTAS
ncbi:LLM class flavin-dependent oxidoreductase [Mycolicibacterium farcinogenes]|nr:LLM class flavin-dependent oxidoreductase [Mycolicibacterium farcinogenes]